MCFISINSLCEVSYDYAFSFPDEKTEEQKSFETYPNLQLVHVKVSICSQPNSLPHI